jgi:hypothetical protein
MVAVLEPWRLPDCFGCAIADLALIRAERAQTVSDWNDGRPETEPNFKFYRRATNKIGGISDEAAAFLRGF